MLGSSIRNSLEKFKTLFVCGFGLGFIPFAPGTWGTLGGVFLFYAAQPLPLTFRVLLLFVLTIPAIIWIPSVEKKLGEDAPAIVIDEIIGVGLAFLFIPFVAVNWALGFVFFRIFDILKPFGINKLQKIRSPYGVLADDLAAGLLSLVLLLILQEV